ncbi:hypothetical protein [Desulfuromonas thiophila]|jgi:hypothetical protein|uniref:Uncharacterized protein n=1 Tax=Desulfuromonas thiophila TaxID=57664 RepID=A0A1G7FA22_9BACT|nr:hypothetical protein [Desulfuromonas thiophila]MDY0397714.1 hypothetical protein [Desulfuromonas thiophila]SDE72780.1 hypothetical protein SAMN05661003_1362 [Desulfuromonas thiophila]
MSGLYLLALIGVWLLAGWVIYRLWRRWHPQKLKEKVLHIAIGFLIFCVWFGGAFWEVAGKKMYWDAQVRKLCAIDGGVKVYETVELPEEMFNQWGQPNFYQPTQGENALGKDYIFRSEIKKYRKSDPSISRRLYQVFRKENNKILGETVIYVRSGGDLPGPWHGSTYRCPEDGGIIPLLVEIFEHQQTSVKEGEK